MIIAPMPPALMAFREDNNGSDSSDIGTNWRPDFDSLKRVTNRAQCSTPASNTARQGGWETYVAASDYNGGRLLTDNWAVESQLIAAVGGSASDNTTCIGGAMLDNGPASGMVLVYFAITTGIGSGIFTYSASAIASPGTSDNLTGQTIRSGNGGNVAATSLIRMERRMYTATASVFTAYVNGSSVATWDDSGGIVPAGDRTKRRWFIQAESNFPIFQQAFYSPALDWQRAYDLKT